jgi:hypothetical protein
MPEGEGVEKPAEAGWNSTESWRDGVGFFSHRLKPVANGEPAEAG